MAGRRRAIEADAVMQRDLALMTAYFAGALAQADWKAARVPNRFDHWLDQMTRPVKTTVADRVAAFEAMAMAGFDVTVTRRPN